MTLTASPTATKRRKLPFTPIIRRRLRRVRDLILKFPKQFDQGTYGPADNGYVTKVTPQGMLKVELDDEETSCGTACCIAGWMHAVTPLQQRGRYPTITLANSLGLGNTGYLHITSADGKDWPEPFAMKFAKAKTDRAKAKVAAARIDFLLRTGE